MKKRSKFLSLPQPSEVEGFKEGEFLVLTSKIKTVNKSKMKKNKEKKPTMNSLTDLARLIGKDPKEVEEQMKKDKEKEPILYSDEVEDDDHIKGHYI